MGAWQPPCGCRSRVALAAEPAGSCVFGAIVRNTYRAVMVPGVMLNFSVF